jgi:hypothetical protein
MRVAVPLAIVAAGLAALTSFALAHSEKSVAACDARPAIEQASEMCTASARLCENWERGRATFRATFVKSAHACR